MKVTYFNGQLNKRCTLIDKIRHDTAEKVVAKFGNKEDRNYYMEKTRIENDDGTKPTAESITADNLKYPA